MLKQVQERVGNSKYEILRHLLRSSRMCLPPRHPEMSPALVALRCLYSGSLNRGNAFPSKLLLKYEMLKQVQHDCFEILKQVLAFGDEKSAG